MGVLDAVFEYRAHGLACFALPYGSKEPPRGLRWRQWHNDAPTDRELAAMFNEHNQNIAIVGGRASGNLVVLDADSPAAWAKVLARLDGLGIDTWTVQRPPNGSDHDGGGHAYLRTPEPVKTATVNGLEVRGQGTYVLAPPSQHDAGGLYHFVTRPASIFTLPDLALGDLVHLEPAPPPRPARRIPRWAWRLLNADPDALADFYEADRGKVDRSDAECSICASLARAGYDLGDALALFQTYPGPGKFAEKYAADPRDARRYLTHTWRNTRAWIAEHDSEAGCLARHLRTWALSRPWPGRGGSSDRAVYLGHLDIVERCGRDPHAASARELGERAGVSWQTAVNANRRLVDAGLLELTTSSTPSLAHCWRLCTPDSLSECNTLTLHHRGVVECQSIALDHDAFRWHALNKSGAEVLGVLVSLGEPVSVARLAELTGRCVRTVRYRLGDLFTLGLAELVGSGLWRAVHDIDMVRLDAVARELGTAGAGERQRRQHARERRLHRLELERGKRAGR
ncbi:MAG: bifunctional DNA primase/polymerase [Promethearchaeota archaeon]